MKEIQAMSNSAGALVEAFIIDKLFDHSRKGGVDKKGKKHADMRGPRHFAEDLHKSGKPVAAVLATSVHDGVQGLIKKLHHGNATRKIHVLRFYGHGAPGVQILGANHDIDSKDKSKVIDLDDNGHVRHAHLLSSLRHYLVPKVSRVELHGCTVAAQGDTGDGQALLVGLANLFRVPVLADPVWQHSRTVGEATSFRKRVYVAFPGHPHPRLVKIHDDTLGKESDPLTYGSYDPYGTGSYHAAFG
jgi:hypothetical protein